MTTQILCPRLKKLARSKGLTDTKIAELSGIPRSAVSRLFKGNHNPTLDSFLEIYRVIRNYAS
jgi:transcriptional regulator with XRE-family HTH domain